MKPILFHLFGLQAASAPAFAGIAALAAYLYFAFRRRRLGLSDEDFWVLMGTLAIGVFAGSVLFYAVFYGGGWLRNWEHWRSSHGIAGGASMGTFAGAFGALAAFCRWRRVAFWPLADATAAAGALGLFFMRVGCLLYGCDYGRPTTMPWAIVFSGPCAVPKSLRGIPLHPTQIYEGLAGLVIFFFLAAFVQPKIDRGEWRHGDGAFSFLALYGAARFFLDFTRASDPGVWSPLGLNVTQWVCAVAALAAACSLRWRRT